MTALHPYDALTPDVVLDAVETFGVRCTGALLPLNSYENRVYRVDTEEHGLLAAKFYRPGRWSDAAIREEHAFTSALAEAEVPVVAPLVRADGATLCAHGGFRFAVFPWARGRSAELNQRDDRVLLGRYLARLHRIGASARFDARPELNVAHFGEESVEFLLGAGLLPDYLRESYATLARTLIERIRPFMEAPYRRIRLHGDCHLSNLLWTEHGPRIVDFDDCRSGPAVQDLWMLLSGSAGEREAQLGALLEGYSQFAEFDPDELLLIEPLRSLRLLHYAAWLARRWQDPAFPRAFPWFNTPRYWEEHLQQLREQLAAQDEPTLSWRPEY